MGIYLTLYSLSDASIERLHADPPLAFRVMFPDNPEYEQKARQELQPRPGLFARLFKGAKAEPPPAPPPFELPPGEGDLGSDGDFEKSWGALHYLLTGTEWEGEPPLNFLMHGRELDARDGDAPLITHDSAATRRIADALAGLSDEEARRRVNVEEMQQLNLHPGNWDDPQHVEYLIEDFRRLRGTVSGVAQRGLGLLVNIS
jgi:hypothetical protein